MRVEGLIIKTTSLVWAGVVYVGVWEEEMERGGGCGRKGNFRRVTFIRHSNQIANKLLSEKLDN